MKSLYLRVWLTVVGVLALFALGSGWLMQRHVIQERERITVQAGDRLRALGELIGQALPEADAPEAEQREALRVWSDRLRLPLALDDARGRRLAVSPLFERRMADAGPGAAPVALTLDDGRTLWVMRGPRPALAGSPGELGPRGGPRGHPPAPMGSWWGASWLQGPGLLVVLMLLFVAVAAAAYPLVRRLTRRLETLQQGVERFGAGALGHRVHDEGRDEVARLAGSFNRAADRIQALVEAHGRLLANASHELRSPLARLKMAVDLLEASPEGAGRDRLRSEVSRDLQELDELIEELLLASRLQAGQATWPAATEVELVAIVAEEAARCGGAAVQAQAECRVQGQERLLRRAIRNLLENAVRYGQGDVEVRVVSTVAQDGGAEGVEVQVLDRGPGVPVDYADRIFEPFFRMPGHAESAGGVGLGLSLVRQIALHHGGRVRVEPREGGGSRFSVWLPRRAPAASPA